MTNLLAFRAFLGLMVVLTAIVVYSMDSWEDALFYLPAVFYGGMLEYANMHIFHGYYYSVQHYLLNVGPVPLVIALGWGGILYSGWKTSRNLPIYIQPLYVALYALSIDLAMDVIAIRLGYWTWTPTVHPLWFGVPLSNFYGWFCVAILYTFLWRALRRYHWTLSIATPLVTLPVLIGLLEGWGRFVAPVIGYRIATIVILILVSLEIVRRSNGTESAPVSHTVSIIIHGYYVVAAFAIGAMIGIQILVLLFFGLSLYLAYEDGYQRYIRSLLTRAERRVTATSSANRRL